ncbi:hypothetical protein ABB30_15495 [Stenotrophomonas ginsengisoli]|uniref:SPARC/Testican calcium-binding domain-containing protein n=1 Tax=Stenotrophomonas ginsengisoli TaxID=336566 RepID=A0A0R0D2E9_9GAMM|nr:MULTISPECIES: hypothetical protein [Stenotrophomonas]KRG72762.1 hypothetical protein ABB30_15495 [Stenotrophomonas ginsengisoli]QOF99959.1 hypothetical protein H7691_07595 [Stenotrophomonas sp. CW117]
MKIDQKPTFLLLALVLLVSTPEVRSSSLQDEGTVSRPANSAPTTCIELAAWGDAADFSSRGVGMLKQRCDLEDIQAKFAELDRNQDGYLSQKELPVEHTLSQYFSEVDFDGDKRLSLAEVAEHDAETSPIE